MNEVPVNIMNSTPATWGGIADAGRRHVDPAGIGFGIGDELGNRLGRERGIDLHDEGTAHEAGDRSDVAGEVDVAVVVERSTERVGRGGKEQRIAIRRCVDDGFEADIAAGARTIFDDDWLAEPLRQRLRHEPRNRVVGAAGSDADDQTNRLGWIVQRRR
jgi:hypothetical protein